MKFFIDTEFIESPGSIQLISIGIVAEDGREYYAVSSEYNYNDASDWVKENVINPIYRNEYYNEEDAHSPTVFIESVWHFQKVIGKPISQIKEEILAFIGDDTPEFWGYYADYDWVIFCWIFGKMIDLPKGWPMYCRDTKQLSDMIGAKKFKEPNDAEHNALEDAKWTKKHYNWLKKKEWDWIKWEAFRQKAMCQY